VISRDYHGWREREQCWAYPPEVEAENTIGAGDSAVAGFVYGLAEGRSHKEALNYAVAAGTATTLRPGTCAVPERRFFKPGAQDKIPRDGGRI